MFSHIAHTGETIRSSYIFGQLSATEAVLLALSLGFVALITVLS
jgi:hypothetical protein